MPELRLPGCTSRPLVGYLKALGILRVIGRQVEGDVHGRWRDGVFELRNPLDAEELHAFFLDEYRPLPILSPWNGRSGFYPKGNATAVQNLTRIEQADDPRLSSHRALIAQTRKLLDGLDVAEKPDEPDKERLIRKLRQRWPDDAVEWLDAAIVLTADGLGFPQLLGSGGNDGSYDFSSNVMAALATVLLDPGDRSATLLSAALSATSAPVERVNLAHLARDASPTNSPTGNADSLGNPWDLILGIEGTVVLTAGTARRYGSNLPSSLAAPFTVRQTNAGYGSAADGEAGRAELWLPLWERWATLAELTALVREARAQVGRVRQRQATTGLDFARAAGELGVARGISAFERYTLLERVGEATLAVPTGRIKVENRRGAEALDGIDSWLSSLLRLTNDDRCPQGPRMAIRQLCDVVFKLAARDNSRLTCSTLEAIGATEASLSRSSKAAEAVRPLSGPPAAPWIAAADDGSHEFAVAVAIASLRDGRGGAGLPQMRDYLHGTKRGRNGTEHDPDRRHAIVGENPIGLLAAIHSRRHLDAGRSGHGDGPSEDGDRSGNERPPGLGFPLGIWAPLESVRLLAADELDDDRILALARGLVLLSYTGGEPVPQPKRNGSPPPLPGLELLELVWRPVPAKGMDERVRRGADPAELGARPGWAARLAAGATRAVIEDAARRLQMAGLPPRLDPSDLLIHQGRELELGRRLGAALLARLGPRDISSLTKAQILSRKDENRNTKEAP